MTYRDRILDDGTDRDAWLAARIPVVGASDAAKLAKPSSVPLYLASKLERREWHGNEFTEQGHRWEPMMLAWAGIDENKALIHAPDERGFASTPDGISTDERTGAECKAKHNKVVMGPTLGEWRQLCWQFVTVPEFETIEFIWQELVTDPDTSEWVPRADEPKHLTVRKGDPKIRELHEQILPIATDLLARLTAALAFEKEMS